MQTWDAITSRRNVRQFANRPIAADSLTAILEAGRRAPSSNNSQPWAFVVVTDRAQLAELSKVWRSAGHVAGSAATLALVAPVQDDERRRASVRYDLGQATMAMLLVAADLGIGSCHASVADQDLARRILGIPADRYCAYLIALGYPSDRPLAPIRRPDRRPFEDVVHWDRW
jgi:nitroreductase